MVDLHTHSRCSDGSETPPELVASAVRAGLTGIALTDHDSVEGIGEFLNAAADRKIEGVPGVEISTMLHGKEIHVIGLYIDPASADLQEFLAKVQEYRTIRNRNMIEKLNILGYAVSEDELLEVAGNRCAGRPHMAHILASKGYFPTVKEAFMSCLKRGARAYTQRTPVPPSAGIQAIHQAGGLAFWAHPIRQGRSERSLVRRFLRQLVPEGLDGLEVRYPGFSPYQSEMLQTLAAEFGISVSGGSDYHGTFHPGIQLGTGDGTLSVPDEFLVDIKKKWLSGR